MNNELLVDVVLLYSAETVVLVDEPDSVCVNVLVDEPDSVGS